MLELLLFNRNDQVGHVATQLTSSASPSSRFGRTRPLADLLKRIFMIIFNINAGFCIALVWAIGYGLRYMVPTITPVMDAYITPILILVVGGLAEKVDLRPRIFFIPLWFVGVTLAFRATYIFAGQSIFWPLVAISLAGAGLYLFKLKNKMKHSSLRSSVEQANNGNH